MQSTLKPETLLRTLGLAAIAVLSTWFLILAIAFVSFSFGRVGDGVRPATCQLNLKQIGLACVVYESGSKSGIWPALSSTPGQLSPRIDVLYPEYINDLHILFCPSQPVSKAPGGERTWPFDRWDLRERLVDRLNPWFKAFDYSEKRGECLQRIISISDASYVYLGYVITTDEELAAFAEVYKQRVQSNLGFDDDLSAPLGKGSGGGNAFLRLREGVESQMPRGENGEDEQRKLRESIPVMFDRMGNHQSGGCNVIYLDGHASFVTPENSPKSFPVTPLATKILSELDGLGPPLESAWTTD